MAPCFSGSKRPLAMIVYDPAAAAQQPAHKRARQEATTSAAADAGAMVPHDPLLPPLVHDAKSINAVPPQLPPPPPAVREEHPCLRKHFLSGLRLRADLPVHFIDDKSVTSTDLNAHQNRFRIPSDGVMRRLRAILTPRELHDANLLDNPPPRSRPRKRPRQQPDPAEPQNGAIAKGEQHGEKIKKPKKKGKAHGGLSVNLVDLTAGAKELVLSRWDSNRGSIVKGEGYLDFIRRCSFKEKDAVEIWAFVQRRFRNFGVTMCDESLLHLLIVKKDQRPQCRYCTPPAPAVNPSIVNS